MAKPILAAANCQMILGEHPTTRTADMWLHEAEQWDKLRANHLEAGNFEMAAQARRMMLACLDAGIYQES